PEGDASGEETEGELRRTRWIPIALAESKPDEPEDRREHDDEDRLGRLKPGRRHLPTEDTAIGEVSREQIQRRRGLLERAPENRREQKEHDDDENAPPFVSIQPGKEENVREVQQR